MLNELEAGNQSFIIDLKARLLSEGLRIDADALIGVGTQFKENNYGYNNPNKLNLTKPHEKTALMLLPQEIVLPGQSVVSVRHRPNSPFVISRDPTSDRLILSYNNKELCSVGFSPRPRFWRKVTTNGISMKRIGSLYGLNTLIFFLVHHCELFDVGLQCGFCSLLRTRIKLDPVELRKEIAQMKEVLSAALEESETRLVYFLSGSQLNFDEEVRLYLTVIEAMRDELELPQIEHCIVTTMPPRDFGLINELFHAGLRYIKFNLEVYGAQYFDKFCPGKSQLYGREKFLNALEYAVRVFGSGHVLSNLIVGLEPPETLFEGMNHLASIGVVPEGISFHPDQGTSLAQASPPEPELLIEASRKVGELCNLHGYRPFLNRGSLRGSLSWEMYDLIAGGKSTRTESSIEQT